MVERERESERESCNSRHFSRCLMKSCFPNPTSTTIPSHSFKTPPSQTSSSLSSLPDDLLLEILSRLPLSSLPSISTVSRRWNHLLHSPSFLLLRRTHRLLHPTLFAFSPSNSTSSSLRLLSDSSWALSSSAAADLPHARLAALGRRIHLLSRSSAAVFDPWTATLRPTSSPLFPRKRFAAAAVSGKLYVAGGSARTSTVEEYNPDTDEWRVVSDAPRMRYGCIGVGVDGVFYIIGGLKIGGASDPRAVAGAESRAYASSMDLYETTTGAWLRSRAVPGGGCVVAACGANGHVYVLASHAVELSFWRFGGGGRKRAAGEWCRMRGPPLPAQVRVDGSVRFSCVGAGEKVVLIQVMGCIDDLLRRSGRSVRGYKQGLVLVFDCSTEEWSRGPDLPHLVQRPACICVDC